MRPLVTDGRYTKIGRPTTDSRFLRNTAAGNAFLSPCNPLMGTAMNGRVALLCLAICFICVSPIPALVEPSPTPPPAAVISPDNPKAFDPAAATQAWLETVPPEKRAKSDAYFEGGYWLILWNFLLGAAILVFLLASRWSAGMRNFAERVTRFKTFQVMLYAIGFAIITFVLGFPLEFYQSFVREHAYGLATQNFAGWVGDEMKGLIVSVIAYSIFLGVLYAVFRRAPRLWWAWGTGVAVVFLILGEIVAPVLVAPLFNNYQPLTDPQIRDSILALARANEIPVDQVYEFDASRQTTRVSANVSGFLSTTRISLNDNLLKQCSLPEIRYVMGHEMGHYVLNHSQKLVSALAALAFIGFLLGRVFFSWAVKKWGESWQVGGIADPAGFPLLVLLLAAFEFVLTPVSNSISRITEREADAFGLNTSRESNGMAQAALKLATYRKLNPGPLEEIIFYDHPSGRARIRMAMDWKAAQLSCGDVR
jgi:STE24 endopeptidase